MVPHFPVINFSLSLLTGASDSVDVPTLIEELATVQKNSQWVCRNGHTVQSSWIGRVYFSYFGKRYVWTRQLMNIDLVYTRQLLDRIGMISIDKKDCRLVLLFNQALCNFNSIAPKHALPPVFSDRVEKLMSGSINTPVREFPGDLLHSSDPCDERLIRNLSREDALITNFNDCSFDNLLSKIRAFEKAGGRVAILPSIDKRENPKPCLGVRAGDELIPVCHMGISRSQMMRMVCLAVKYKLGCPRGSENVRPAHGILGGYDTESYDTFGHDRVQRECFESAFDFPRPYRYGHEQALENCRLIQSSWNIPLFSGVKPSMKEYFRNTYYRHLASTDKSKVYLCFADTGLTVMEKLLQSNPEKNLRGISVVFIPDHDWLSYYNMHPELAKLLDAKCKMKLLNNVQGLREGSVSAGVMKKSQSIYFSNLEDFSMEASKGQPCEWFDALSEIQPELPVEEGAWLLSKNPGALNRSCQKEMDAFVDEVLRECQDIDKLHNCIGIVAKRHIYYLGFRRYAKLFQTISS